MKRLILWIAGICALALVCGAEASLVRSGLECPDQAPARERTISLSLDECIVKTLKNNLGLAAEMLTPRLMDETVALAGEKFYPSVSFSYNKQDTKSASYSFLDASDIVTTRQNDNTTQLSQNLPTGGALSVSLYNYLTNTNRSFQTISPATEAPAPQLQPALFKNSGFRMSRREIIVAGFNREVSENLKQVLEDAIYRIKRLLEPRLQPRDLNVVRQS
jgi:hypothetical protein